jgi:hypothetical protein
MDEKEIRILESAGWPAHILEIVKTAPQIGAVDQMFADRAYSALSAAESDPLTYLAANPQVSLIELSSRLARQVSQRVSAIGLIMAIYNEAAKKGVLRAIAKDLLIREIHAEFPHGWSSGGTVSPLVKIGMWDSQVSKFGHDPRVDRYALQIIRELTIDHPPCEGWTPKPERDPLIEAIFDRYWPVDVPNTSSQGTESG